MRPLWVAPLLFGAFAAHACQLNVPMRGRQYSAVVLGPSPPEVTKSQTAIAVTITGGLPSARYLQMPRVLAEYNDESGAKHTTIAAVTDGVVPKPGAHVWVQSRYLDPSDNCRFIPWTVVSAPSI